MTNFFTYLSNKCKQYTHRMFYIAMNNTSILHYGTLYCSLLALDQFIIKKIGTKEPYIVLISNNILFKSIIFIYCFITGTKLVMISPKFPTSEIFSTILSKRGVNFLLIDNEILLKIKDTEREEGINILQFFKHVETTLKMLEILLEPVDGEGIISLKLLFKKGNRKRLTDKPFVSILSPGTTSQSSIVNVPYRTFGKSVSDLSYFMGLKSGDKVSVIANFELYPMVYTILGLLNGTSFVQLEKDGETISSNELKESISTTNNKPNVFFISTDNFRYIWDGILSNVYSKKFLYYISKYNFLLFIVNYFIRREVRNTFGKQATKVHILNEELGYNILDILKCSKIMFSSSYGFLEQGNFLAFKDPSMLKDKNFMLKPGGSILKDTNVTIENLIFEGMKSEMQIGDICIPESERSPFIPSDDIGFFVPNISAQGDRKYLYVTNRKKRVLSDPLNSLSLLERSMKDTFLIRDCFIREVSSGQYEVFLEPREELLDTIGMTWEEYYNTIQKYLSKFKDTTSINISSFAILNFNGMRNIAGKLQYYIMQNNA